MSPTDDLEEQIKVEARLLAASASKMGNSIDFRPSVARVTVREVVLVICSEFSDSDHALNAIDEALDALQGYGDVTRHSRDRVR